MWNDVKNSGEDFSWVLEALEQGTCTWVTDESYMEELRTDVRGAGWIFYCARTGHKLAGSFYEESAQAGSYRAERLGLLAIHLLLAAIMQHFGTATALTKIYCDNEGGLYASSKRSPRVKAGPSQADISRVAQCISRMTPLNVSYK